jgi:hypothetical protein
VAATRRQFLRGIGGALVPIPFLASLQARGASAPAAPHPLVIVRQANGVAQASWGRAGENAETDAWWPSRPGRLTQAALLADSARSTSVLWKHAEHLLMVKGAFSAFPTRAELHASGGNQLLTAQVPGPPTHTIMTYGQGESVDNLVARMQPEVNGGEPLTLFTGRRAGMGEEVLSYRGKEDLRAAEDDPWSVYRRLLGGGVSRDLRRSVNDLVLEQLDGILKGGKVSAEDRLRLEQHTDSVRDFEVLCARLAPEQELAMEGLSGFGRLDDNRLITAKLHCDVIALALSCDLARAVTLQIGDRTDLTSYTVNGEKYRPFHSISHREQVGDRDKHIQIDRLLLGVFDYLLNVMTDRGLLDTSTVCYVSELGEGVAHTYYNLPWIIAGGGDGTLRTGLFLPIQDTTNNRMLNTLIASTGLRREDGGAIDDFGDPTLEPGLIDAMVGRPI